MKKETVDLPLAKIQKLSKLVLYSGKEFFQPFFSKLSKISKMKEFKVVCFFSVDIDNEDKYLKSKAVNCEK